MSNNIPIDDLFREKLSGGKEQLNLGAWANMERMLNGQNPYSGDEQEPKRKRRILPFIAIFLLLSTAISAGYFLLTKKDNIAQDLSQPNVKSTNNNTNTSELKTASNLDNTKTPNQITPNQINSNPEKNTNQVAESSNFAKKTKKENNISKAKQKIFKDNTNNQNTQVLNSGAGIAKNEPKSDKGSDKGKAKSSGKNKDTKNAIAHNGKPENTDVAVNTPKNNDGNKAPDVEKGTKIVSQQSIVKNRDGSLKSVSYKTLDSSTFEIAKTNQSQEAIADNTPKDKNYKYHPRYVGPDVNADEPQIVLNSKPENAVITPNLSTAADGKEKKKSKGEKAGVFNAIGAFTTLALTKIGEAGNDFFRMFTVLDPGISLGVNAALFKTKDNYGGFHAGLTNHTAISETFSLISELKFFLRNNSGYTINDIRTYITGKDVDTFSTPGYTTYSYQVDSTTRRYNFKSFMSLELPVMLSGRFNNLSVYGGPNFAYNMKFKVNEIDKNYPVPATHITVPNGTAYNFPDEKSMQYARSDFGSRFGIGYAVGVSYNFNPKIYLDIRLSKVVWDNTKTNTQREISNGVTKVPFTQLSLGYKFKNK